MLVRTLVGRTFAALIASLAPFLCSCEARAVDPAGDDAVFSPELQDSLGVALLNRRGLQSYQAGRISARQFQANLAHEWASVANPATGRVLVPGQHLGTTSQQIQAAISAIPRRR